MMSRVTLAAPFGGVRGCLTAAFQQDKTGLPGRQADEMSSTQDCFMMEPLMEDLIEYTLGAFLIRRCPWHEDIGQGNILVGFLCRNCIV